MTNSYDVNAFDVRQDFPFLQRRVNDGPVIYFDNAATTQKPEAVISAVTSHYASGTANVHRAVNFLAEEVTQAFEQGRETIARFVGAHPREIILTAGATHGINLVCKGLRKEERLRVLTTTLEHHSNLLPWSGAADVTFIPWNAAGYIDMAALTASLQEKPDLVAVTMASNFLGALQPIAEIVRICHESGAQVLVDAAQAIAHVPIDVRQLECDYLVFSGHKIYGPGGTGALYVKNELLETLHPATLGGGMVKEVHADRHVLNDVPYRFEAGTPNIEGVIGLASALTYVNELGYEKIAAHESRLLCYAKEKLSCIPGICQHGPKNGELCAPLVSFGVTGLESPAVAKMLGNRHNVIVRSGFHCAQAAHDQLGIGPTVRASFAIYNTCEEVDIMIDGLRSITRFLK